MKWNHKVDVDSRKLRKKTDNNKPFLHELLAVYGQQFAGQHVSLAAIARRLGTFDHGCNGNAPRGNLEMKKRRNTAFLNLIFCRSSFTTQSILNTTAQQKSEFRIPAKTLYSEFMATNMIYRFATRGEPVQQSFTPSITWLEIDLAGIWNYCYGNKKIWYTTNRLRSLHRRQLARAARKTRANTRVTCLWNWKQTHTTRDPWMSN